MFSHIKTSKANKEVVTQLTNKLGLGPENVIARIALAYSLAQDEKLDLKDLMDSSGKEYSKSVLFGDHFEVYLGMVSSKYNLHFSDKDMARYVKLHLDDGLVSLNSNDSIDSGLIDLVSRSI